LAKQASKGINMIISVFGSAWFVLMERWTSVWRSVGPAETHVRRTTRSMWVSGNWVTTGKLENYSVLSSLFYAICYMWRLSEVETHTFQMSCFRHQLCASIRRLREYLVGQTPAACLSAAASVFGHFSPVPDPLTPTQCPAYVSVLTL